MPKGRCNRFDYFFNISYMCNWGDDKKTTKAYEHHESTAYQHAEKYVEELLKSPKTAEFPSFRERQGHVVTNGLGGYTINS